MKAVVAAFNQEKALVGAFSVIVQPIVEPMDSYTALLLTPLLRSVSPLLIIVITVNTRPPLILSGYTCYTDLHLHPSRLTFTIQNM